MATTMERSKKGVRVARPREKQPDRTKPEGQICLYVQHLLRKRGIKEADFAEAIGVQRSTVFNWFRGIGSPPVKLWPAIAAKLRLKDWRSVLPPQKFIDELSE